MATLKEYISAELSAYNQSISDVLLDIYLSKGGLTAGTAATKDNVDKALAYVLVSVLPTIPKSVSEGGYSVTWNYDGILARARSLASSAGIVLPELIGPTVSDASSLW